MSLTNAPLKLFSNVSLSSFLPKICSARDPLKKHIWVIYMYKGEEL